MYKMKLRGKSSFCNVKRVSCATLKLLQWHSLIHFWQRQVLLPQCAKVVNIGDFAFVQQCKKREITFSTEIGNCGAQLRYNYKTIGASGFELMPYYDCAQKNGLAYITGTLYRFTVKVWQLVSAQRLLSQHQLFHYFNHTTDNSF